MDCSIRETGHLAQVYSSDKTNTHRAKLPYVSKNPSLTSAETEAARLVAQAFVESCGSQRSAAVELQLSKSMLSEFLNGGAAGMKLVSALARVTGKSLDEVLGHRSTAASSSPLRTRADLASLPGYPEALAELLRANERSVRPFPADVIDEAATVSFSRPPSHVTVEFLRRVVEAIVQGREDAWRDETAEIRAEMERK